MSDISPMRVGDTDPDAVWQFYDRNGNLKIMPTGTTFILHIKDKATAKVKTGAGTWDTSAMAAGSVTYHWNAQDTAAAGDYQISAQYTKLSGQVGSSDWEAWKVE